MVDGEHSDPYKETQEWNVRVFYKLKVNENPTLKNMPHEEDFDDGNYESIEEHETAVWNPPIDNFSQHVKMYNLKCKEAYHASTPVKFSS